VVYTLTFCDFIKKTPAEIPVTAAKHIDDLGWIAEGQKQLCSMA